MPKVKTQKNARVKSRNTRIPLRVEIDPSVGDKVTKISTVGRHTRIHSPMTGFNKFHIDITFENGAFSIMGSDAFVITPHVSNSISIAKRDLR